MCEDSRDSKSRSRILQIFMRPQNWSTFCYNDMGVNVLVLTLTGIREGISLLKNNSKIRNNFFLT